MTIISKDGYKLATYGAKSFPYSDGVIPYPFPRVMSDNCMAYIQEVIESGLTSDMVERFESRLAEMIGTKHCIATSGCTPALAVIAAALNFEPGDEIIVSPVTDFGSIQGLCKENLIPVFPDTAPDTINFSADTIEPCITDRTRAILVVHKTGIVCDMDSINALAEKYNLFVYEDACQALFGMYKGRLVGTLSQATAFSFDPEKILGSDIGGAIVTNDDELAERMRLVGISRGGVVRPHFGRTHPVCGYAYRMPQITAAVCLAQLEIVEELVKNRDFRIREIYNRLAEIPGIKPLSIPDTLGVYSCWMAGFNIDPTAFNCSTESFSDQMDKKGIRGAGMARYYLMPASALFLQEMAANHVYPFSQPPASKMYDYRAENCPNAQHFLETFIRWVISERYTEQDVDKIIQIVSEVAEFNRK